MNIFRKHILIKLIAGSLVILISLSLFLTTGFRHAHTHGNEHHEHHHHHSHKSGKDHHHENHLSEEHAHIHTAFCFFSITIPDFSTPATGENHYRLTESQSNTRGNLVNFTAPINMIYLIVSLLSVRKLIYDKVRIQTDDKFFFLKRLNLVRKSHTRDAPDTPPPELHLNANLFFQ